MSLRMFGGELKGQLHNGYIYPRADDVRIQIAVMFQPGAPREVGWKEAMKEGWRVVPVSVQKIQRNGKR